MSRSSSADAELRDLVAGLLGEAVCDVAPVQSLWSGYGQIVRMHVRSGRSVIVKCVRPPSVSRHPRGHDTGRSHERKLRSYQVEQTFYEEFAPHCGGASRLPGVLHLSGQGGRWVFVLEDLDQAGYARRAQRLSAAELHACLAWLAAFHATFLGIEASGLWSEGAYWHLETRPDEWQLMAAGELKRQARRLDEQLRQAKFRTLIHGDAKVANFCFASSREASVAAVDFQYVGGGVGTKDVAYFISSVLSERESEQQADGLLDVYFQRLRAELAERGASVNVAALEREWRELYPVAWADFTRFLQGWAPGHAKLHGYSARMSALALDRLATR